MSFEFREVRRENVPLMIGVAGGTGSGKTFSALRLARGLSAGQPFAVVDTENGRAKHYADLFPEMRHGEIHAPFRPDKYADAITAGALQFPVVVVDSASHEWAGEGGCLDWHDELMGNDQAKKLSAWIEPKRGHKRFVTRLLQLPDTHVILCFRAEPKVDMVKDDKGRWQIVPKASLTGLDGWLPISEKMLPYELTASFLLMADAPGVPRPIKLQEQHKPFVPLNQPLSEETGAQLAAWAAGTQTGAAVQGPEQGETQSGNEATGTGGGAGAFADETIVDEFLKLARERGKENLKVAEEFVAAQKRQNDGRVDARRLAAVRKRLLSVAPEPVEETLPI